MLWMHIFETLLKYFGYIFEVLLLTLLYFFYG